MSQTWTLSKSHTTHWGKDVNNVYCPWSEFPNHGRQGKYMSWKCLTRDRKLVGAMDLGVIVNLVCMNKLDCLAGWKSMNAGSEVRQFVVSSDPMEAILPFVTKHCILNVKMETWNRNLMVFPCVVDGGLFFLKSCSLFIFTCKLWQQACEQHIVYFLMPCWWFGFWWTIGFNGILIDTRNSNEHSKLYIGLTTTFMD